MTPFLGMVASFGFNFAPQGWQMCNGQIIAISQNTALFSLLGTQFGGDGQTNFALPDLMGRVGIHMGQGSGLSPYEIGESSGTENVTLTSGQMPEHSHAVNASSLGASSPNPGSNYLAMEPTGTSAFYSPSKNTTMNASAIAQAGGSQPHSNLQPFLVLNYCIAMVGIFPSRG